MLMNIDRGNPNITSLIRKTDPGKSESMKTLNRVPNIKAVSGRVKICISLRPRKEKAEREKISRCKTRTELKDTMRKMDIWRVLFKEKRTEEDKVPTDGWCGYLSMGQIIRKENKVMDLNLDEGCEKMIEVIDQIFSTGQGGVRNNWKDLTNDLLSEREVLLSVRGTLNN